MSDRSVEVQTAVRLVMTNDTTLMTTLGVLQVYDTVPSEAPFPYIRVSDFNVVPQPVKGESWFEYFMTIHVWSQDDSTEEVRNILSRIYELFHRQEITMSGNDVVSYMLNSMIIEDPDSVTYHGVIRLRITD